MATARVKLTSFRVRAYRSCKDVGFRPNDQFTVLIGPNGSGKTNILNAILLLSTASIARFPRFVDEEQYTNKCEIDAEFLVGDKRVDYRSKLTYNQNDMARDQVIVADEKWRLQSSAGNQNWIDDELFPDSTPYKRFFVSHYQSGRVIRRPISTMKRSKSRVVRGLLRKDQPKLSAEFIGAYEAIQTLRLGIRYYSASQFTNPSLCPTSFEIDEDDGDLNEPIQSRQLPHTRFLYDLYTLSKKNDTSYSAFLSLVGQAGVGLIDEIRWQEVKFESEAYEVQAGGKVITKKKTRTMIIPTVQAGTSQLSFNQLSEGTLRTLAMLFYITTDKSELLLLEEPEVCVHHGLLNSVVEIIQQFSHRKQIIISTHSDAVLDSVAPEQLAIVDKNRESGTVVRGIDKVMSKRDLGALREYLNSLGSLGEYWRHSGFGG
jgi:ABC-type Mn2+/Zn2+ transport system ATPase subunit